MLYLQLPPTDGTIAGHIKEQILDRMSREHTGYLHAAGSAGVSKVRAGKELKADKAFAKLVQEEEQAQLKWLVEEYINLSDTATEKNANAVSVKLKARWQVICKLEPRFKDEPAKSEVNVAVGIVCDEAMRAKLIEQRQRLLSGSNGHSDAVAVNVDRSRGITEGEHDRL